jgi:hypothetical protein
MTTLSWPERRRSETGVRYGHWPSRRALGSLGLSGALVAGLGVLAPYQAVFRLAAIALLGPGLWLAYTRKSVLADGAACAPSRSTGWTKPVLWAGAAELTRGTQRARVGTVARMMDATVGHIPELPA